MLGVPSCVGCLSKKSYGINWVPASVPFRPQAFEDLDRHHINRNRSRILSAGPGTPPPEASQHFLRRKYVEFVRGEPADPTVIARMRSAAQGRTAVVLLDAGQVHDKVLEELRAYAPLVSSVSYLIVQDTDRDAWAGQVVADGSPYEAIQKFLAADPGKNFETDPGRESALFTRNAGGWLRRK